MRAVFLEKNAKMTGFTVTGGRTAAVSGENTDNVNGGGILARDDSALIADCIISNNVAQRGGGGFFGTYQRCRFFDNAIVLSGNGAAVRGDTPRVTLRNCLFARNDGWSTVYFADTIDHCTFAADNAQYGNTDGMTLLNECSKVNNTLILGWKGFSGACALSRCVLSEKTAESAAKNASVTIKSDCLIADAEEMAVDARFAPVIGANKAVDAADAALCPSERLGPFDVYGRPRAVNGARADVGAVEAVWLPVYARALGSGATAVTAASPEVALTEKGVEIPAGSFLAVRVGKPGQAGEDFNATVSVAPQAACTFAWGESDPFETCGGGDGQTITFALPEAAAELTVASYDGTSVLAGLHASKRFMIFLR